MNSKQYKQLQSTLPGSALGVKVVRPKDGKPELEKALKVWKRQLKASGKMQRLKNNMTYTKPTTVRREQKKRKLFVSRLHTLNNM